MAITTSATRFRSQPYRWQAMIWLIVTLSCGVLTVLVWMYSEASSDAAAPQIENKPISTTPVNSVDITQLTHLESLRELDTDVQPLDLEAVVRDLRQYPDEFKDKRYLVANKGKWTIQVMNVAENNVIVDYLSGRKDRNKFAYFRYRDDNDQPRYMLTYGIMSSPQEALGGVRLIDFGLPANVRVLPEEVNRYLSIIDNYELAEPVVELGSSRVRQVRLQPTKREVPVHRRAAKSSDDGQSSSESERSDADQTQQTGTKSSQRSIRQSTDTDDTLAIREKRVLADDSNSSQGGEKRTDSKSKAASNKESSNKSNKNDNTKPDISTKSQSQKNNKAATSNEATDTQSRIATDDTDKRSNTESSNSQGDSQSSQQSTEISSSDRLKQLIDQKLSD